MTTVRSHFLRSKLRTTRSYSLDSEIVAEIERTKGQSSVSERVNRLLSHALLMERKAALAEEAADFFANAPRDRLERRAFQKMTFRAWAC